MSGKDGTSYAAQAANLEIVRVNDVEVIADSSVTRFSKGSDNDQALFDSVTTSGVEYDGAKKAFYNDEILDLYDNNLLTGNTYNIYLDSYGNAIGVDRRSALPPAVP